MSSETFDLAEEPMVSAGEKSLQQDLEAILSGYLAARQNDSFGRNHPLWARFESIVNSLASGDPVKNHPNIRVSWSMGQGN